ncbi:MAG: hypothetical protein EG823_08390 [Actinobacteria bacterium]|nr:hypothetical protein [Actinomycetota bacterium]
MTEQDAGRTLAQVLAESGRMPLGEGLAMLDDLLRTVGELHRSGAFDGALTPSRVMLAGGGRVVVLPATAAPDADADEYRSPQLRDGQEPDARADVYALGVLAYRTLMGVYPYSAGEDPIDPHQYLPDLTDRVRRVFTIAVQKNLTERFADALTFRAALRGDSDVALDTPTLKWAVPEGIPEGDTGAADEFASSAPEAEREEGPGW